jgi:cleavage stimulation factor subunit 3
MSEPPPADIKSTGSAEISTDEDQTQPSSEILNALNLLKADAPETQPNSQEDASTAPQEPVSEWDTLRKQLRDNPRDPDGWRRLVDLAEDSGELEKVKETYDGLLEVYPNTSSAQIAYLSHFLSLQLAGGLFKRFLVPSPSVDLWKFYLTYVRRLNIGPEARDNIRQAYEFALNHIGQDKDSGEIWNDYIQFIKAGECSTTWDEQQKMDALRKIYNRAVQIPLDNVERLWHELEAFETGMNRIIAKKIMADLSPSHMQARTVLRQLQKHLGPLLPPPPPSSTARPTIFLPSLPTFNQPERALVGA